MLNQHLMLFFTGVTRFASEIAASQIQNLKNRETELKAMQAMVPEAIAILSSPSAPISDFGKMLHESWCYKRSLSEQISNGAIDEIYQTAVDCGAEGGKILGAGGGGFILIFAAPEFQAKIREKLSRLVYVPFKFENSGSSIAFYQPDGL